MVVVVVVVICFYNVAHHVHLHIGFLFSLVGRWDEHMYHSLILSFSFYQLAQIVLFVFILFIFRFFVVFISTSVIGHCFLNRSFVKNVIAAAFLVHFIVFLSTSFAQVILLHRNTDMIMISTTVLVITWSSSLFFGLLLHLYFVYYVQKTHFQFSTSSTSNSRSLEPSTTPHVSLLCCPSSCERLCSSHRPSFCCYSLLWCRNSDKISKPALLISHLTFLCLHIWIISKLVFLLKVIQPVPTEINNFIDLPRIHFGGSARVWWWRMLRQQYDCTNGQLGEPIGICIYLCVYMCLLTSVCILIFTFLFVCFTY